MVHFRRFGLAGFAALSSVVIAGCGGAPMVAGPMTPETATASAALNTARGGPQVLDADLELSCEELGTIAAALYARHAEITGAARDRQQRATMLSGLANVGIGALGTGLGLSGGLSGLRAAGVATSLGSSAANAAILSGSEASLKEITDTTTIVNRLGQLERARLQKNCPGGPLSET